jgi:hypothetical protein
LWFWPVTLIWSVLKSSQREIPLEFFKLSQKMSNFRVFDQETGRLTKWSDETTEENIMIKNGMEKKS